MNKTRTAKFTIGQVVRHRLYPFRGIVFDIDPVFANTEPLRHPQVPELFEKDSAGGYRRRNAMLN
jgi:heat shock protein HspQ